MDAESESSVQQAIDMMLKVGHGKGREGMIVLLALSNKYRVFFMSILKLYIYFRSIYDCNSGRAPTFYYSKRRYHLCTFEWQSCGTWQS